MSGSCRARPKRSGRQGSGMPGNSIHWVSGLFAESNRKNAAHDQQEVGDTGEPPGWWINFPWEGRGVQANSWRKMC
jgi:hypothetical protein